MLAISDNFNEVKFLTILFCNLFSRRDSILPTTRMSDNTSASSRSSSVSSEQENMRPPLQRMAPVSPPSSPQGKVSSRAKVKN